MENTVSDYSDLLDVAKEALLLQGVDLSATKIDSVLREVVPHVARMAGEVISRFAGEMPVNDYRVEEGAIALDKWTAMVSCAYLVTIWEPWDKPVCEQQQALF